MIVSDFLKKSADRNGFLRERFEERKIPTDMDGLVIMPFFGDFRGLFLLSSWFLHRYKENYKPSKYFILASWPGFQNLFPYVDEYWSILDEKQIRKFYEKSDGFRNLSEMTTIYQRNFNEFFRDVVDWRQVVEPFYHQGIKQEFWDVYKNVRRFLPHIPSSAVLGKDFMKDLTVRAGYKIFISPLQFVQSWRNGKVVNIPVQKEFWLELVKRLLKDRFVPVVWQNFLSYDLSVDFTNECIYIVDKDIGKILSAMRASGCVLDIFGGLSRLAIAARSPFVALDERSRYFNLKEYEVDDLCAKKLPKEYIFTFSTIIADGTPHAWGNDLFNNITNRLNVFLPSLNRDEWPATGESTEVVLYDNVREIKTKKIGAKLLKVTRD